jgi:protein TonB
MPSVFADDDPEWITTILPPPPAAPPIRRASDAPPPMGPVTPTVAPTGIAPELPIADPPRSEVLGIIDGAITNGASELAPPPPPPLVKPPEPVRVGHTVRSPQKLHGVDPVYPAIAQAARIQGIVIIEATIGADGRVVNARILRSVPMLDQSALDAVRQWEYTPTLLNGVPVPVIMTVTVSFTLSR